MKMKKLIYGVLMGCMVLGWTNIASAQWVVSTNKQTYKVGEPIIVKALFHNNTQKVLTYSIPKQTPYKFQINKISSINDGGLTKPVFTVQYGNFEDNQVLGLLYSYKYPNTVDFTGTVAPFTFSYVSNMTTPGVGQPFNMLNRPLVGDLTLFRTDANPPVTINKLESVKIKTPGVYSLVYRFNSFAVNGSVLPEYSAEIFITIE